MYYKSVKELWMVMRDGTGEWGSGYSLSDGRLGVAVIEH